jgi:hypothetical protein
MAKPSDPIWHQQREQEIARHILSLIQDKRFVVDTLAGRKGVVTLDRQVVESDQSLEVKRRMIDLGSSDHALQRQLPTGRTIDLVLKQKKYWVFDRTIGQVRLLCVPPTDALIRGEAIAPMNEREVRSALASTPPPLGRVPLTVVLFSSAGFTKEAQGLADRLAERTVILVEPNDAGGWSVYGTPQTQAVLDLLDPEDAEGKRQRIRDAVDAASPELSKSGLSAEKVSTRLQLPLTRVEEEFKRIAADRRGLVAKRFDGRLVLYRESAPPPSGGSTMPILDKFKSIFASSNDKKIAFLAERRTQIAQQRDRVQEELHALEQHDGELREQFKKTESPLIRKRITTQMVQLQKDLERKQQLTQMLNQQANVVAAHLHSLELIQQGQSIKLPSGEELAEDAAKAEEILAQVQADAELAGELTGGVSMSGLNSEEQAMYEQLMKDAVPPAGRTVAAPAASMPVADRQAEPPATSSTKTPAAPKRAEASPG